KGFIIDYYKMNITDDVFLELKADVFLCTLPLHYFKDEEILKVISRVNENACIGIVVNDLQRSSLAYRLFHLVCFVFQIDNMSREDGLLSILRRFKRKDLVAYSKQLNLPFTLQWRWAFRYQWIISKA